MDLLHPNIAVPGFHETNIDTILIDFSINIVQYRSVAECRIAARVVFSSPSKNGDDNIMTRSRNEDMCRT
jgi:hypothetical protein